MSKQTEQENDQRVCALGETLTQGLAMYIENGYSPGEVSRGVFAALYSLMKSHGMTDMQISNQLHTVADEIRELAFAEKSIN